MVRLFAILVFVSITHTSIAQYSQEDVFKDTPVQNRIFTGGGLGLGFGNIDWVNVSPVIGYRITNGFAAGVSGTYRFTNYKIYDLRTADYGGSIFLRQMVRKPVFVQAEYEYLNFEYPINLRETRRSDFNSLLAGVGMAQPFGRRGSFIVTLLYNLSHEGNSLESPYDSPWLFRGGVTFGL